jgi:hypothetical protein
MGPLTAAEAGLFGAKIPIDAAPSTLKPRIRASSDFESWWSAEVGWQVRDRNRETRRQPGRVDAGHLDQTRLPGVALDQKVLDGRTWPIIGGETEHDHAILGTIFVQ